jgi:hypothetical protein
VTLPPGWSVLSVPVAVPGLPRDRAAAPDGKESDGVVLVGMAPRDAHNPELVSPRLHAERPSEARLGELAAYRYDGLRWNGRSLTVYAAPTTAGVATVACLSPVSDCARIAASLQVPGAKGFPLGPDRAFAAAARRALKTPARSLAARTTKGQASAAAQIATDYRTARARIAHVKAGPADEPLRADLTRRLDKAAHAYRDLATAAAANARKRFASAARRAHAAEQLLRGTVRASVYRGAIDVARPRTIPALRRPPVIVVPAPTPLPRSDPPKPAPTPAPRTPIPPTPTPKRPKYTPCDFDCVPRDSGEG